MGEAAEMIDEWAIGSDGSLCVVGEKSKINVTSEGLLYVYSRISGSSWSFLEETTKLTTGAARAFIEVLGMFLDKNADKRQDKTAAKNTLARSRPQRVHRLRRGSKSGFTGVTWDKREGRWRARAVRQGVQRDLGYFDEKMEAVESVMGFWRREEKHVPPGLELQYAELVGEGGGE